MRMLASDACQCFFVNGANCESATMRYSTGDTIGESQHCTAWCHACNEDTHTHTHRQHYSPQSYHARSNRRNNWAEHDAYHSIPIRSLYCFPFLFLNSSMNTAALLFGTIFTLTNSSVTSILPPLRSFSRMSFLPALINPPETVSM